MFNPEGAAPAGAPVGAAYLAGMSAGFFEDTRPLVGQWLKTKKTVRPDAGQPAAYAAGYAAYRTVRESLI